MHLLLAEDNTINQRVVQTMVSRMGHTLTTVNNGQEAVDQVRRGNVRFHAILMDMMMPVMTGIEATKQLRDEGCTLHIIALTANAGASDRRKCLAAGMDDFMTKPFDMEAMRSTLGRVSTTSIHAGTFKAFVDSMGEDDDFLSHLFTEFLSEANRSRSEIHAGLKSEDADRIQRVVHNLKANAAMFGALTLADICSHIERNAISGDFDGIRQHLPSFDAALTDVQKDIQSLIPGTTSRGVAAVSPTTLSR